MVEHFGHLTQRPSGISFLRDLEEVSFGFLAKLVAVLGGGGGVTAGSTLSRPNDFLVKDVVAICLSTSIADELKSRRRNHRDRTDADLQFHGGVHFTTEGPREQQSKRPRALRHSSSTT